MDKEEFIQKNKVFFEKWAKVYNFIEIAIKGVRKYISNLISNSSSLEILDLCTGTGSLALKFATKNGHNITGIDLSEAMLIQAHKRNKFSNLRFMKGDATNLPFDDSNKDICSISFGLHDMPQEIRLEAFNEMVRFVKPTGYLIVADYNRPKNSLLQNLYFKLTAVYESEFYPSWYWGNYFTQLIKLHPCSLIHNKTFLGAYMRILVIKPKK